MFLTKFLLFNPMKKDIKKRLDYLRGEIERECVSYGEIAELQSLAKYIDPSDTLLLEWAGVPEFPEDKLYIEVEADKGYKDSFWFEDITVASKGSFVLIPCGEVKVITPEGDVYNHDQALDYAFEKKWKDKDLHKFEFLMNNWFEVQEDKGEYFECLDAIYGDYDEAIQGLKDIYAESRT